LPKDHGGCYSLHRCQVAKKISRQVGDETKAKKTSRKDAKAQRLRQRKQNSREKAQKDQKEFRFFGEAAVSDLQIRQLSRARGTRPFFLRFLCLFAAIPNPS
jgi:hypothetical protein